MPKTTKEIIEAFQNLRNFTKIEIAEKCAWYSEQELQDKLKDAEKRIDKYCRVPDVMISIRDIKGVKQILHDCFGDGK